MTAVQVLLPQLVERRERLQAASQHVSEPYLYDLLAEVDAALNRIEKGTFGFCETCHDPIEPERLECDPMIRFCLDHMSQAELHAHQQDLDLATQIQFRLLPPKGIALKNWDVHYRYQPAGAVGGDYCEMIRSDDGRSLFFAVGDVAGKGVAASLLMTHLSAIFRSLVSMNLPLDEIMSRANRLFCEGTPAAHYATLVCGLATDEQIELCDAGHCAPLVFQKESVQRLDTTGLPLGMFCSVPYSSRHLQLSPGDCLLLYSDGITEAHDPAGVEFGEDRLMSTARRYFGTGSEPMTEGILREVAAFSRHQRQSDDITLLVVQRR